MTVSLVRTALLLLLPNRQSVGFSTLSLGTKRPSSATLRMNLLNTIINYPEISRSTTDAHESIGANSRHSASDWLYNIKSIPQSGILREIRSPVLAVAGWSFGVALVHNFFSHSSIGILKTISRKLCIPGTAHSFLVSALGLLLVFRTNSSYQRFYEGRKIWESILNISRNLSRMIELYSDEVGKDRKTLLLNMIAAFPYLLRHHIRPGCLCQSPASISPDNRLLMRERGAPPVDTRYEGDKITVKSSLSLTVKECWVDKRKLPWSLFTENSLQKVSRATNRPLWVCDRLGKEVMSIKYGPNYTSRERLTMLSMVSKLTDALGKCERIRQTAVPLNYARHSLRSLTLWLFTLPFTLVKDMGLLTVPVTTCTAWLLYGIYQIGYSIEDPFQGSLRLSILCDAIRRDVLGDTLEDDRESAYFPEDGSWEQEDQGKQEVEVTKAHELGYADGQEKQEEEVVKANQLGYAGFVPPISSEAVSLLLQDTSMLDVHSRVQKKQGAIRKVTELACQL